MTCNWNEWLAFMDYGRDRMDVGTNIYIQWSVLICASTIHLDWIKEKKLERGIKCHPPASIIASRGLHRNLKWIFENNPYFYSNYLNCWYIFGPFCPIEIPIVVSKRRWVIFLLVYFTLSISSKMLELLEWNHSMKIDWCLATLWHHGVHLGPKEEYLLGIFLDS